MLGTGKILFNFLKKHKVIVYYYESEKSEVTQSCPTLCDPMGCSLPAFSVHGIFQARILEWVAISFSGDLPDWRTEPGSPALQADSLPTEPSGCGGLRGRG